MSNWSRWLGNRWEWRTVLSSAATLALANKLTVLQTDNASEVETDIDTLKQLSRAPLAKTASFTLTTAMRNQPIVCNKADGMAIVLPAASGSGDEYEIVIGTTITSVGSTIKVANAYDVMQGVAIVIGSAGAVFGTAASSDTITFNGTTTGGLIGSRAKLKDVAANKWQVEVHALGSGTAATPFSATVS